MVDNEKLDVQTLIEHIPYTHIKSKLIELFGSIELEPYITSLLINDSERRDGFPYHILEIFFELIKKNDEIIKDK